jgi:hypothetical protein
MTQEWYVARKGQGEGKRYGPVPLNQLRDLVDSGKVRPDDLVWNEGMTNWQRADQCPELFPAPAPGPAYDRPPPPYGPDDRDPPYRRGGYPPYDDRPYRRYTSPYRPPVQSSNAWIIPVAIFGGLAVLAFLGCGAAAISGAFRSSSSSTYSTSSSGYGGGYGADPGIEDPVAGPLTRNPYGFAGGGLEYSSAEVDFNTANKVGNYLNNSGHFTDGKTIRLSKVNGAYQVSFQVGDWNDPNVYEQYRRLPSELAAAPNVFPQFSTVNVCLCDFNWTPQRTIFQGD